MFLKENFSKRLFELRTQKNLKQEDLGNIAGITKQTISKIENGDRAASIEVIYALADYFDVSIDYLVGRSDEPKVK